MSNERKPNINKGYVPYGPATGKNDPGRDPQMFVDQTPYEGDIGHSGEHVHGFVPTGPATGVSQEEYDKEKKKE